LVLGPRIPRVEFIPSGRDNVPFRHPGYIGVSAESYRPRPLGFNAGT
jgi:hypothetical protein